MLHVELRLYKRFDADLLSLYEFGVPITEIAKRAVVAYAHGEPLEYLIGRGEPFDFNDKKSVHLRLTIRDEKAEQLLLQIKHGFRNQFVKTLVRNALKELPLAPFFSGPSYIDAENERIQKAVRARYEDGNEDVIILDGYRKKRDHKSEILKGPAEKSPRGEPSGIHDSRKKDPPRVSVRTGKGKKGKPVDTPADTGGEISAGFAAVTLSTDVFQAGHSGQQSGLPDTEEADDRNKNFLSMFDTIGE